MRVYKTDSAADMARLAHDFRLRRPLAFVGPPKLTKAGAAALRIVKDGMTALEVARKLGISHTAASNRLRKLVESRKLVRKRRTIEGGGHEYVYWKS